MAKLLHISVISSNKEIRQVQDSNTRNNEDLDIPKFRTCTGQRTFKYGGTKIMEPT